tara:strand:+ start:64 stop:888 length:825 start_codon:yes stop_codon:yes gene_type:complete
MNWYQNYLLKIYLPKILTKPCPDRISRSGEKGKKVNCISIAFDKNSEPFLLVDDFDGETLNCRRWDGTSYSIHNRVGLHQLDGKDLSVVHYYGLNTVYFSGVYDFIFGYAFKHPYLKIHLYNSFYWLHSYFYKKKKLVTKQRMELVKYLWELKLNGTDTVNAFDLMSKLYSIKWITHPEGHEQKEKVKAFLEALADTGELKKNRDLNYKITGHALRSIEEYEEQERKHNDNVKIQHWALILTLALVLLTATQAELIKVPTIIDLTAQTELKTDE